ncbi:MAG: CHAT domain-containing protein, partial [Bacteroidota bacterium]
MDHKAYSLRVLGDKYPEKKLWYYKHAFETYLVAIEYVEDQRRKFGHKVSEIELSSEAQWIYDGVIHIARELYQVTGDEKWLRFAFMISERGKSGELYESRRKARNTPAYLASRVPTELLMEGEALRQEIAFAQTMIQDAPPVKNKPRNPAVLKWRLKVFQLQEDLAVWENKVAPYLNEPDSEVNAPLVSLRSIQKDVLEKGEALIEIYEGWDDLWVFMVTKDEVKLHGLKQWHKMAQNIETVNRNMGDYRCVHDSVALNYGAYCYSAHWLYQHLFAPFEAEFERHGIQRLIIVPDGPLHQLPFEVLLTAPADSGRVDFANLPYLIKKYEVRTALSAGLLYEDETKPITERKNECLAFAPSYVENFGQRGQLQNLRALRPGGAHLEGAQKEVAAIAQIGLPGRFFFGPQATEQTFKSLAPEYRVLHLALHGKSDAETPENS